MLRTTCARVASLATAAALLLFPCTTLHAQQALVYCPVGIDATGCNAIVAAIAADAARFPGGADAAYDGTGGTVDLATADLTTYAVFVVPSLADGPDAQPYSLIRNGTIAGRLQAAFVGRTAVWSGTPDVGTANRGAKDALIQNLAAWAKADGSGARGPGLVVLQDNSDDEAARYGWLTGVSGVSVAADPTLEIYSNAEVLTATGQTILTNGSGLQIGYTNMASAGLVSLSGLTADATGGRSGRPVLATAAGEGGGGGIATVHTDKEDYSPGETVIITGSGWEPGETVSMVLHEDPTLHENRTFTAVGDASGNIYNNSFVVDEHDLGVRFTLVATGQTSGRTAQTTFTDGTVKVRSQLSGITYTLTWTTFTTTTCTGSIDEGPNTETNVGASGGAIFNKGVGSTASIRLSAPALSDQGGTFTGWSSDAPGSFTIQDPPTNRVICVNGNFSGNREYTASYTSVPDLNIDKSHSGNFSVGANGAYTLSVSNVGTTSTSGTYTVTDVMPTGLTYVSASGSGWTCNSAPATTMTCTRSTSIGSGNTAPPITLNVAVGTAAFPSVTNTASVNGGGEGANTANNSDSDPTTVLGANLSLTKTHTGNFTVGVNGTYTLTVSNAAGGAPTSAIVTVTDNLPTGVTFVSGTGTNWSCSAAAQVVTCIRPAANTIAAGANAPAISLVVSVATAAFPSVTNTASVSGGGEPAANAGDNSANDPTTVVATDLTIDKSHTGSFTAGTNGTYTLAVTNVGTAASSGTYTATDVMPTGLTYVSALGTGWTCNSAPATTMTCTRSTSLTTTSPGNAAPPITLTVLVGPTAAPSVTNTASVSGGGDANAANNSDSDPTTVVVVVVNQAPVVDAGGPYSGNEGSAIALNTATATDADGDVLTYKWTYAAAGPVDAGTSCTFSDDAVLQPTFTCNDDGSFTVTLTVDDAHGHVVPDNATVTVANVKPTATAGGPYSGSEGAAIQLTGSGDDPGNNDDDPKLTYLWTVNTTGIDAGGTCTFDDATKKNAKVTCTDNSNATPFTLTLVATDDDGASSTGSTANLTIANADPVADAGGPYSGDEGAAISLNGTVTDVSTNDTHTWSWAYIAGPGVDAGATCAFSSATAEDPTVTCTDDGTVELTFTATDDNGGTGTDKAQLTVKNAAPVAHAGGPYSGTEGVAIELAGSATDAGGNDTHTYKWTVDVTGIDAGGACTFDDDTKKDAKVTCTDNSNATPFKLKLVATDDDGAASTASEANLTVANADPVADAGGPYDGDEGETISLHGTVTDAGSNDTHTWSWVYVAGPGVDAGATCQISDATAEDPTITCTDDGTVKLTLTVEDDNGGTGTDEATLTLANVAPVAKAGGPYTGTEGAATQLAGSATDAGANDVLSYKWTVDVTGIDGGGTCTFDDDTKKDAKITCDDNGTASLTLTVKDDDAGTSSEQTTLTVANANPVANAGGPYSGSEGAPVSLSGAVSDAGSNDVVTHVWTYAPGVGASPTATCSFSPNANALNPTITCNDNGSFQVTLTATDDDGGSGTSNANVALINVAPVLGAITAPVNPVDVATAVAVSAPFTDQGKNDTHTGSIDWGDGSTPAAITETPGSGSGTAAGSHIYSGPGVYTIKMTVTDDDAGVSNQSIFQYVVIYDPSAGFVTGGGYIMSPVGAYVPDPTLVGKANFGFVAKYQKGKTIPDGDTEFQFHAASVNFKSTIYQWLVVQGTTKASYKGEGTINGAGAYGFMLSVVDGGSAGDKFRIKIWDKATSVVVYDNQMGGADDAAASQAIASGSIVIHTNGGVASK